MLTIDGETGGGQLLRTALSLSAVSRIPFEIEHIRGARPDPGLKPQHLATVRTMADLCDADVEGTTLGAESLRFEPGSLQAGDYDVDIGTAGSISLLFDAVLPLATQVEATVNLTAIGGTDVKWSPPIGYLRRVKLPLLRQAGLTGSVAVGRTGFYPAGGGRATLSIEPSSLEPLRRLDRGQLDRVTVFSKASLGLEDREVAHRQASRAVSLLEDAAIPVGEPTIEYVESTSDGSVLLLRACYDRSVAGFDVLGERGTSSEAVAEAAVDAFLDFQRGAAVVDRHMADQVLVYLALAGGRVRVPATTAHVETNAAVIERFGFDLRINRQPDGTALIEAHEPGS